MFDSLLEGFDADIKASLYSLIECLKYRVGLRISTYNMPETSKRTGKLEWLFGDDNFELSPYMRAVLDDTMDLLVAVLSFSSHVLASDEKNMSAYKLTMGYLDMLNMQLNIIFQTCTGRDQLILLHYAVIIFRVKRANSMLIAGFRSYNDASLDLQSGLKRRRLGEKESTAIRTLMDFTNYNSIQVPTYYEDMFISDIVYYLLKLDHIYDYVQLFDTVNMGFVQMKMELFSLHGKPIDNETWHEVKKLRSGMIKALESVLKLYNASGIRQRRFFQSWLNELHLIDRIMNIRPGMPAHSLKVAKQSVEETLQRDISEAILHADPNYNDVVLNRIKFLREFEILDADLSPNNRLVVISSF